jgi:hypothetical protein
MFQTKFIEYDTWGFHCKDVDCGFLGCDAMYYESKNVSRYCGTRQDSSVREISFLLFLIWNSKFMLSEFCSIFFWSIDFPVNLTYLIPFKNVIIQNFLQYALSLDSYIFCAADKLMTFIFIISANRLYYFHCVQQSLHLCWVALHKFNKEFQAEYVKPTFILCTLLVLQILCC